MQSAVILKLKFMRLLLSEQGWQWWLKNLLDNISLDRVQGLIYPSNEHCVRYNEHCVHIYIPCVDSFPVPHLQRKILYLLSSGMINL